jgi:Sigma-70, region 4
LSSDHRAVVELCYFEGRSCAEIAEIMGCPVSTVKTRMFHARRRLRALMADSAALTLAISGRCKLLSRDARTGNEPSISRVGSP